MPRQAGKQKGHSQLALPQPQRNLGGTLQLGLQRHDRRRSQATAGIFSWEVPVAIRPRLKQEPGEDEGSREELLTAMLENAAEDREALSERKLTNLKPKKHKT